MDRLSDIKLQLLKTDYIGCLWYITKQNCSFRDMIMMASILEMWNDNPNESFESFFDRKKKDSQYIRYLGNTPHRALKNCEFYGIMTHSLPKSKVVYSPKNLTDVYYRVKFDCEGNYANTEKYQEIINQQLETMEISVNGNSINPIMYTLKILLLLGDATSEYQMSTQEFKLFVCTSDNWNQYYQTVESILRFRTDSEYKSSAIERYDIANGTRFNMVLKNLSYLASDTKTISIKADEIPNVRKKVAEFEIGSEITTANKTFNQTRIYPLQQIFYGAPGTGKSHEINRLTEVEKVIRTTFHPDSDYSTFVGAYKPVMEDVDVQVVPVVLNNGIGLDSCGIYKEKRIAYKFVKQAFLKAYLGAWKKYADSCSICCTPAVHEFDTGNGRYVITSVGDYGLTLSREFKFPKNLVQKEWTNLWNDAKFNVPRGQQTGKSVQHAIANWIFEKIDACTVDKFEEGWKKLVDTVKNGPVAVQKTQTYIIIAVDDDNETLTINVEARGKKRATLRRKFYESDETKPSKLEKTLVGILEGYSKNDFDEAWDKLKKKVEEGKSPNFQDDSDGQIVPQFLVIEEINRGNCAQIFGDIFQLLDRGDNGFSVYPIEADSDLRDAIKEAFTKEEEYKLSNGIDIDDEVIDYTSNYEARLSEDVQEGRVLLLPPNLYIWATMNTSDQSLFPIDSAFKRRWDWIYTPIAQGKDENGNLMNWQIEGQGDNSWWTFIQGINEVIDVTTHSEDKKLGFFFCKAQNDVVKKETFVNKVVFYLWNDVFKVYGFKSDIFNKKDKDDNTEKITFKSFYNEDGSVNEDTISVFVKNVMAKAPKGKANGEAPVATEEQNEEGETQA